MPTMVTKKPYAVLLTALFISGASGLINQIAWQRAVKVYLANSETLSSMIVVLVFMLGLGLGSLAAARRSGTLPNPFLALGLIEVLLCAVNVALIFVFGEELRAYGYALEAAAGTAGISPSLLCALLSFAVLSVPCFLMGLTIPVAAEAAQRQLEVRRKTSVVEDIKILDVDRILSRFDRPRLDWGSSSYIITDDHPLVEHPAITRLVFAHKN